MTGETREPRRDEEEGQTLGEILRTLLGLWRTEDLFVQVPTLALVAVTGGVGARLLTYDGRRLLNHHDPVALLALFCTLVAVGTAVLTVYIALRVFWDLNLPSQLAVLFAGHGVAAFAAGHVTLEVMGGRLLIASLVTTIGELIASAWAIRCFDAEPVYRLHQLTRAAGLVAAAITAWLVATLFT